MHPTPEPTGRGAVARSARRGQDCPVHAYEQALREHGEGGAYLQREGLYSSLISEWRKLRDAGALAGLRPGAKVGRLSAEQAEIARFSCEWLEQTSGWTGPRPRWTSWEKHTRSWSHCPRERTRTSSARSADRDVRKLTGLVSRPGRPRLDRACPRGRLGGVTPPWGSSLSDRPAVEPANKLTDSERGQVLAVLNGAGSSIGRRCRSMPCCSTRANICVRCPRCTGCSDRTHGSPNAAGWPGTPARHALSWSRPDRSRCTAGTSPNSRARPRAPISTRTS